MITLLVALSLVGSSFGSGLLSVLALGLGFAVVGMAEIVYRKPDGSFVGVHNWGIKGTRRVGLTNWRHAVRKNGIAGAQTVFSGPTADADADAEYDAICKSAVAAGFTVVESETTGSGRQSKRVDAGSPALRFDAPKPTEQPTDATVQAVTEAIDATVDTPTPTPTPTTNTPRHVRRS